MRTKLTVPVVTAILAPFLASPAAYGCSILETPGKPRIGTIEYVRPLIHRANLIIRARALRYGEGEHFLVPPDAAGLGGARGIEFEVLENLTPAPDAPTARVLYIGGDLTSKDDFNSGPVPYLHLRTEGQRGSCFASVYRVGGEFLLLLRVRPSGYYTPYWAALAPLNEQIHGPNDPWVQWVRRELSSARSKDKTP